MTRREQNARALAARLDEMDRAGPDDPATQFALHEIGEHLGGLDDSGFVGALEHRLKAVEQGVRTDLAWQGCDPEDPHLLRRISNCQDDCADDFLFCAKVAMERVQKQEQRRAA